MLNTVEVQSPKCVTTDYLGRICGRCGCDIDHMRADAEYCSRKCQKHAVRDEESLLRRKLRNVVFAYRNRDKAFTFDGRYEGTTTDPIAVVYGRRKDKGYSPMPIDVHVNALPVKFNTVTPEDVIWAVRQRGVSHSLPMPRPMLNYCTCCKEAVIDGGKEVRVTKGCYLPIEHECPRTRVYDLRGKLLEVIQQC